MIELTHVTGWESGGRKITERIMVAAAHVVYLTGGYMGTEVHMSDGLPLAVAESLDEVADLLRRSLRPMRDASLTEPR